jgi:hypothetical protein
MGNSNTNSNTNSKNKHYNISDYTTLDDSQIQHIRKNYKVIDINWLDAVEVHSKMFNDDYFKKLPEKEQVINNMLEYYLNNKYKQIYRSTDYLCDTKEEICICNTHADDFRKIYQGINYKQNIKYVSWCKKEDDSD